MKKVEDGQRKRKPRSDRKRHIQPVISVELDECLDRIAFITSSPFKDVCESLCKEGLHHESVIRELSINFRRDYCYENLYGDIKIIPGEIEKFPLKVYRGDGDRARVSIRFSQEMHDRIGALAYALDLTISSTTTVLLETAFSHNIGLKYIERFIRREILDPLQNRKMEAILSYINKNNPSHAKISMSDLLDSLAAKAYNTSKPLKLFLAEWINQYIE